MPQFLIPPGKKLGETVVLSAEESHHLRDVLRISVGEKVSLSDGSGGQYRGEVTSCFREGVAVRLLEKLPSPSPQGVLRLGQALLKGEKMELVLQKAVELGVHSFHPLISSRTIPRRPSEERLLRWQRIADEASKQCDRETRMMVEKTMPLEGWVQTVAADLKIFFWEEEREPVRPFLRRDGWSSAPTVAVVIGPEGGFSVAEVEQARRAGFVSLSLGRRVLRAETAAIIALSLIQYELGNL